MALEWHRDFHPRNVMLLGHYHNDPDRELKIVGFNVSELLKDADIGDWLSELQKQWTDKICSPIVRHYGSMTDFATFGWVSTDMEAEHWLWEQFKDDPRYFPVTWDPEDPDEEPEYQEYGPESCA